MHQLFGSRIINRLSSPIAKSGLAHVLNQLDRCHSFVYEGSWGLLKKHLVLSYYDLRYACSCMKSLSRRQFDLVFPFPNLSIFPRRLENIKTNKRQVRGEHGHGSLSPALSRFDILFHEKLSICTCAVCSSRVHCILIYGDAKDIRIPQTQYYTYISRYTPAHTDCLLGTRSHIYIVVRPVVTQRGHLILQLTPSK